MEKTPKNEKILSDRGTEDPYPPPPTPTIFVSIHYLHVSESNMYTECITRIKIVRVVFKVLIFNFYLYFQKKVDSLINC
jgi:arabinogalactan endo-1,4-beta-galactosidase